MRFDSLVYSLFEACKTQCTLYKQGKIAELIHKGSGADKATRGDWESEETIIHFLTKDGLPLRIYSEEHGIIDVVKNPKYLAILDGIDGSSGLVKNPSSRCGTMLSVAKNLKPRYKDFIFAGITEYFTNKIVHGIEDYGVTETTSPNYSIKKIPLFSHRSFSPQTKLRIDCYQTDIAPGITAGISAFEKFMDEMVVQKLQGKLELSGGISSASMCLDLLYQDIDALAQIVAKGVSEPPVIYFLTTLLGGVGTDLKGNDLGEKKWEPVGMNVQGALFTSSREINNSLVELLN